MYEIGKIYVWQNLREHAHLNGTETTVRGPAEWFGFQPGIPLLQYSETDTILDDGRCLWAAQGELRPKPPKGEQLILALFRIKEFAT